MGVIVGVAVGGPGVRVVVGVDVSEPGVGVVVEVDVGRPGVKVSVGVSVPEGLALVVKLWVVPTEILVALRAAAYHS